MPIRKLPPKGSDKLREAIEEYKEAAQRGNIAALDRLALKWGYANRETFERAMRMHTGVYIGQVPTQSQAEEPEIINLPPIKLRDYKPKRVKRGDEEEAILHASDGHGCKITPSYNEDVYRKRMDTLFDATMAIVTLHRNMYPIRKLHILDTGDNSQGENPHQGSNVGSVKMGARDQTTKIVYPAWVKLIGSLKQEFEEVIFEGVPGNHGYERLAPETSREDLRLYDLLKVYFDNVKGVTVNIHEGFAGIVNILGFKCFLFHGDGIPCQQGVPFFALDRKLKSWYMQYGGFNYAFGGHFHKRHSDEISSRLEYFMCGSLVSDDEWALKKLGISSNPSQSIYGIHPTMGVTWRYGLVVDREFLAEKLPSLYGKGE
ncbi:hypothetical protein ES703_47120 [subsurface metagenome]